MHFQIPGFPLAMTILWIWVGFVVVLVAGWWMLKLDVHVLAISRGGFRLHRLDRAVVP